MSARQAHLVRARGRVRAGAGVRIRLRGRVSPAGPLRAGGRAFALAAKGDN